jgi:hypothetical protein
MVAFRVGELSIPHGRSGGYAAIERPAIFDHILTTDEKSALSRALSDSETAWSSQAGDGVRTHDPQLGKRAQRRMVKPKPHNHARIDPLRPARNRSEEVLTGAQLARARKIAFRIHLYRGSLWTLLSTL